LQGKEPIDFFMLFFPEAAFDLITEETNRYALNFFDKPADLPPSSRFLDWEDVDNDDIQIYIATQIGMGLCSKPNINDYWCSTSFMTETPGFKKYFARNRFELITSFLHFSDSNLQPARTEHAYDPIYKIKPLFDIVRPTYQQWYIPERELSIDESMIKFKGRLSFRQYMPNKPIKWGIKVWAECESTSGYCLDWYPYCGKDTEATGLGLSHDVVINLTRNMRGFGHHLYIDNFYSSPTLCLALMDHDIGVCGTVRPNRIGYPKNFHTIQLTRGQDPRFKRSENMMACTAGQ
jgi:hypothetical protein